MSYGDVSGYVPYYQCYQGFFKILFSELNDKKRIIISSFSFALDKMKNAFHS